jgi:AAA+ superfamily predicted ATPase
MARSDLIISLVRSAAKGDQLLFRKSVEALVAEERGMRHNVFADQLAGCLNGNGLAERPPPPSGGATIQDILFEITPRRNLASLVLPPSVQTASRELVEEHHRADLLRSHGLEPRNRILLIGPPGNGKTSLAEALAESLMVPLIVARYDAIIGSFLGETATRLRRLFEYTRLRRCVLFFDEFDTLGKERGDPHDTGEIKRVVSALLLQIDNLPSHVVVVTATNHAELLDRAVWRRFQLRLHLPPPTITQVGEWLRQFEQRANFSLGCAPRTLAGKLKVVSFSELEDFTTDVLRRSVLAGADADVSRIVNERLREWRARAGPTRTGKPQRRIGE